MVYINSLPPPWLEFVMICEPVTPVMRFGRAKNSPEANNHMVNNRQDSVNRHVRSSARQWLR
ncbi:hypothetical protein SAMN05216285_1467 [Natrinema salifodinae]|uniref:Uncharacterized protein n=1 Tax=Natrinema salifodinae TaxID=1202768 RepID=A0A1I0NB19_9EURY|nr:hypothetical protein SAMN05216285_1467 [Natrinema salifodinae]